jgi:serine/threonine-protein kinase
MLPESEKRAAHLAVTRYGAQPAQVQRVYREVAQAQARGQSADFLESLVGQRLLTAAQAQELRAGLDVTHIDTSGHAVAAPPAPSPAAGNGTANGHEPRQIGNYRILRRLGEGGMGSVYLGYQEGADQHLAIKVLPEQQAASQAAIDRFYREAKSGALLNHPNIVRNVAAGQDQATGRHYLVMEFVDGPSALELLNRYGRLSVGDAVHVILDIARGLEHAHSRNVVHRDIKPDNILITQSGLAKLGDLGLAKRTDEASHLTAARQGFGTPYYMPYEQAMNAKYADGRSDIYALGATLYHLVTGELPFPGTNHLEIVEKKDAGDFLPARAHNSRVPPVLDGIIARMLARDPADRYQTVSELIVDLDRAQLSAEVPSFIDPETAMQDPVVRERLAAPAQPTAPDLQMQPRDGKGEPKRNNPDLWYLRYRDQSGRWCKARATTEQVLKRVREGRFDGTVEASHFHNGGFKPLGEFAEFRAAVTEAAQAETDRHPALRAPTVTGKSGELALPAPGRAWRLLLLTTVGVAVGLAVCAAVVARVLLAS